MSFNNDLFSGITKENLEKSLRNLMSNDAITKVIDDGKVFFTNFNLSGQNPAFEDLRLISYLTSSETESSDLDEKAYVDSLKNANVSRELRKVFLQKSNFIYQEIEKPLIDVLITMEKNGVKIDRNMMEKYAIELQERMVKLQEKIWEIAGEEFNVNSPQQLANVLFEKLKLQSGRKSEKTKAFSTNIRVLEMLSENGHEIADLILDYRTLNKMKGTYVEPILKKMDDDHRVHTTFFNTSTLTGRLSSNDPNLQNIPIKKDEAKRIRSCFIADDKNVLISADYSQIELRLLADFADVKLLKKAFAENLDIHRQTASEVLGISYDQITPTQRNSAKGINFGIIYGISHFRLGKSLGITSDEAKQYMQQYFAKYQEIQQYMQNMQEFARSNGFVKTKLGRAIHLKHIQSPTPELRQFAEREAINAPLQGGCADIIKLAMINIDKKLKEISGSGDGAKMTLQIHDELIFEVPADEVERYSKMIKSEMENVLTNYGMPLSVPLQVDISVGKDLGNMS